MSLHRDLLSAAFNAGGSDRTRAARATTARDFTNWAKENNVQVQAIAKLKTKQISEYGQKLYEKVQIGKLSIRTAQNRMTHLRGMLRDAGRWQVADNQRISNAAVGLTGASRYGTHRAIREDEFFAAQRAAKADVAAIMSLQRSAGLRDLEAIMGSRRDTLNRWEAELKIHGKIHVIEGTKGNHPRWAEIPDLERFKNALRESKKILNETGNKYVLVGKSGTLKSAYDRYGNSAEKAGLRGEISPHSLRYAYAAEIVEKAKAEGNSQREALIRASHSLGHGDGRGRYIAQVYLK
jgi:site-specific recombinase XerD